MFKNFPRIAVYSILFLVPLLTLPFTANTLDFQKQIFLFVVASLGVFAWIWRAINEKKLDINLNPLHWLAAGFAMIILISGVFSLYVYGSLWGTPLPVAESFISILSFVFFYFLLVNSFKKQEIPKLGAVAGISAALAVFYALVQSLGVYLLPFFDYSKDASFNTIGTISSLALYAAIVLAFIFPLIFFAKKLARALLVVASSLLFLALVVFNGAAMVYFPQIASGGYDLLLIPWIVTAVGALSIFVFSASNHEFSSKKPRLRGMSFVLFFVSVLFLVFNIFAKPMISGIYDSFFGKIGFQAVAEIGLAPQSAAKIAVSVLKQSPQYFFLGSGPGTFIYDFIKFKPQELARDNFAWNLTFFSANSEIVNRVATTGALGASALILIIIFWTGRAFRFLTEEKENEVLPLAVFSGWLAVVAAMFLYPFNFSLALLFWLFLGMIIILNSEHNASLDLKSVRLSYAATLTFIAIAILQIGLLVWVSKRYYAETQYAQAVKALQSNDFPGAIRSLEAAAEATDRLQDNYLTGLSQIYFAQAQEMIQEQGEDQDAQTVLQKAAPYLQTAVTAATMSTDAANPNNSSNWAMRGYLYRQLIGISEGFDTWALDMYKKAVELEPANPSLWTEIGQIYVLKNDLDAAQKSFEKAVALRPQLIDPHYYLALIHDEQGQREAAIQELQAVWQLLPQDDTASKENVAKAIENLRQGGSLSAPPEQQQIGDENNLSESELEISESEASDENVSDEESASGEIMNIDEPAAGEDQSPVEP